MKKRTGFTLIELMITLAIIGLLASIIFPNFSKVYTKAKETTLQSIAHTIQMALETYQLTHNVYPSGDQLPLVDLVSILQAGGELSKIPQNPFTGSAYTATDPSGKILYTCDPITNKYTLDVFGAGNAVIIFTLTNA